MFTHAGIVPERFHFTGTITEQCKHSPKCQQKPFRREIISRCVNAALVENSIVKNTSPQKVCVELYDITRNGPRIIEGVNAQYGYFYRTTLMK